MARNCCRGFGVFLFCIFRSFDIWYFNVCFNGAEMTENWTMIKVFAYGIKLVNEDGWLIDSSGLELESYIKFCNEYSHKIGKNITEIRFISQIGSGMTPEDYEKLMNMDEYDKERAIKEKYAFPHFMIPSDWAWDDISECYRAPGEPITKPDVEVIETNNLKIQLLNPKYGWMHVKIKANDQYTCIHSSAVFDPYPHIIQFLEELIDGKQPHIEIDEEGVYHDFYTFNCDNNKIEFIVKRYRVDWENEDSREIIDYPIAIRIDRKIFIKTMYSTILKKLSNLSEKVAQHWYDDDFHTFKDLKSEKIELYLSQIIQD